MKTSNILWFVCATSASAILSAQAAEYTVTSNADAGDGSLRALALASANDDTIYVPASVGIITHWPTPKRVLPSPLPCKNFSDGRPVEKYDAWKKFFHV